MFLLSGRGIETPNPHNDQTPCAHQFWCTEVSTPRSPSRESFPEPLPEAGSRGASLMSFWLETAGSLVQHVLGRKITWKREAESCWFPWTSKTCSWGLICGCSSGNLDQILNPASRLTFVSLVCQGRKLSGAGLTFSGGGLRQFCKWTPGLCGCWAAIKQCRPWGALEGSLPALLQRAGRDRRSVPPCRLALLPGWMANVRRYQRCTAQHGRGKGATRNVSFSLLQGWGCEAYNLCLFSGFFHRLIIAKYFI